VAFYRSRRIDKFAGNLLVTGREGGYLLRIRFDPSDVTRPATTERLLEGAAGSLRAIAVGPDGALYFSTATQLVRLVPRQD
jgi:glucose/arabinose dehydrogenase